MSAGGRAVLATVVASMACLVAALLPWLRTGSASRSAFGLARSAEVLGLFDGAPRRICLAFWYLMPFLIGATWTAGAARRPLLAATLGGAVGVTSSLAGILVIVLARPESGPVAAVGTGLAAIASAALLAAKTLRTRVRRIEEGAVT